MQSFSSIFTKHGFKLWLGNLLGIIITSILSIIAFFILTIMATIFVATTVLGSGLHNAMLGSEALEQQMMEAFSDAGFGLIILCIIAVLTFSLIFSFPIAGSIGMTVESVESNRSRVSSYFKYGFKFLFKMFGYSLLTSFIFIAIEIIFIMVLAMMGINDASSGSMILSVIIFLIIFFLFSISIMHAPVIMMTERTGVFKSIRLSISLLSQAFGKVLGTALLMIPAVIIYYICYAFFMLPDDTAIDPVTKMPDFNVSGMLLMIFIITPLFMTITMLIIVYRYFKHLRSFIRPIYPGGGQGGNPYMPNLQQPYPNPQQPPFTFNPNPMGSIQPPNYQQPNPFQSPPNYQQPNQKPFPSNPFPPQQPH
ncbi:hypothetical protein [Thermoflavimicrobium dichotomicum]|uniref:hypothetical protein n=1 Tax=Thermoflavimicrobium dichotomicum TaxID=46223 RepID=UPI000B86FF6A|nr:hypothetical protein [Thermoflavimicrobium dichotomicum]